MEFTKKRNCSKFSVFLTEHGLRDMSRKFVEADVKSKFDMGKLSLLKLAQLREVCRALRLQTNGRNSRKRTFTEPLDAYTKLCSCRK